MRMTGKLAAICATAGALMATSLAPAIAAPSAPSAPLSPAVTAAAAGSFTIQWAPPASDGESAITMYSVESDSATGDAAQGTCTAPGNGTSCVIGGLDNGIAYTFDIVATNAEGDSPAATTASATALGVPTAPRNLEAEPRDGKSAVSWDAPLSNGGSAITAYTVSTSPSSAGCTTAGAPDLDCEIPGLTNGTTYTVTATATNMYGESVASTSNNVTPRAVPSAPLNVAATPGDESAVVTWDAPASDGGSPVLSYEVITVPTSDGCTATAPTMTCTITGLTNGEPYSVIVNAVNVAGDGVAASPVSVTPYTVPGAPTEVEAEAGDAEATITWVTPEDDGGNDIVGYNVTTTPASAGCSTLVAADNECTIPGLTNGLEYEVVVSAYNAAGDSAASSPAVDVTPRTNPDAPTNLAATPGNGTATITWTAPGFDGGVPITGYEVIATPGDFSCTSEAPTTTCELTGLTNGQEYEVTVIATNEAELDSDPATVTFTNPLTVPTAPQSVQTVRGANSVVVSWSAPSSDGGRPISLYTVSSTPGGASCTSTGMECTVNGLTPGMTYNFTVVATNEAGDGAASSPVQQQALNVPTAPRKVSAQMAGTTKGALGKSNVSWSAPADNGGTPIIGYYVRSGPATCYSTSLSCKLTDLVSSPSSITVEAVNVIGTSALTTTSSRVATTTVKTKYRTWSRQIFYGQTIQPNKFIKILQRQSNGNYKVVRKYRQGGPTTWSVDVRVPYGKSAWKVKQAGYTSPKILVKR